MFSDGLHDKVNIYPMEHNTSNRTEKNQAANKQEAITKAVPCRIIKEEKALFKPDIILRPGDVIEEVSTLVRYEVLKQKIVRSLGKKHHTSYEIKKKVL